MTDFTKQKYFTKTLTGKPKNNIKFTINQK